MENDAGKCKANCKTVINALFKSRDTKTGSFKTSHLIKHLKNLQSTEICIWFIMLALSVLYCISTLLNVCQTINRLF